MRAPDGQRGGRGTWLATLESVVTAGAVVLLLGSVFGLTAIIGSAVVRPGVGDVLLFKPGAIAGENVIVSAQQATRQPSGTLNARCALNPEVMAEAGGSIVVESRSPAAGLYRVHWAGARTSTDAEDCGRSAELTLSTRDLRQLVAAVGGRGLVSRGNVF